MIENLLKLFTLQRILNNCRKNSRNLLKKTWTHEKLLKHDNSDSRVTIATVPWYPSVTCQTLHTNVSSLTSWVLGYNSNICRSGVSFTIIFEVIVKYF